MKPFNYPKFNDKFLARTLLEIMMFFDQADSLSMLPLATIKIVFPFATRTIVDWQKFPWYHRWRQLPELSIHVM